MPASNDKVVIGWIHPGEVEAAFCSSIAGVLLYDAVRGRHICDGGGTIDIQTSPRVAEGRSQVIETFLKSPEFAQADWLLMIDADMTFEPNVIEQLLEHADPKKVPVLGGLCFGGGRGDRLFPTVYQMEENEWGPVPKVMEDYPRDQLITAAATGAAFLLVHRTVYQKMAQPYPKGFGTNPMYKTEDGKIALHPHPWFVEKIIGANQFGEDIGFCLRLAALKIPLHIHTGIKIGHVKKWRITEEEYDLFLADRAERKRKVKEALTLVK